MNQSKIVVVAGVASALLLFVFVLGGLRTEAPPLLAGLLVPEAQASTGSCPIPTIAQLEGEWVVKSARCTSGPCRHAHVSVGDRLRFQRELSGRPEFALEIAPAARGVARARTEGHVLHSDGVAAVRGPITLRHDLLDGSPLQLHWLIVQLRAHSPDASGQCRLQGLIAVCETEPASGATSCDDRQHGGMIEVDPV